MEKKKSYNLLKVIGAMFLLYVVLTWFISTGSFSSGEFVKGDKVPVGLYGIFTSPIYSFAVFGQYLVLLLCIGGFYGVLNKTCVYQKFVNFFASKNKTKVLIGSIIINALLTSVFGETMMIFVLLPFFMSILLKSGYDKLSAIAGTVGASLVGMVASIGGNLAIYKNYFNLKPNSFIIYNIILLVILVFLLCMFVISKSKDKDTNAASVKVSEIPLYDSCKSNKKSIIPMSIVLGLMVLLLVVGLYNWFYSYDIKLFTDLHEKLSGINLFGVNIISTIFGTLTEIGYFSNYDISAVLIIVSMIIAWVYSISLSDFVESFKDGAKKMLLPGIYVVLASTIFSCMVTSNSGNISLNISNSILGMSNDFNILTGSLTGIIGSFFYNDYIYLMNGLYGILSIYNTSMMPFILSVFQSMFGIMMLVLPVSITLIGALKYLDVDYKDWIKYIWKFLIQIFAISIIGAIILSMLI